MQGFRGENRRFHGKCPVFFANFSLVISHLLLYNISLLLRKGLSTWSKSNNRMAPSASPTKYSPTLQATPATSCFGVKGMVGRSKDSGPFQLLRRESMSKGVNARLPMTAASRWSCTSAVDHGVNISALAHSIINEVSYKVNQAPACRGARGRVRGHHVPRLSGNISHRFPPGSRASGPFSFPLSEVYRFERDH